MFHAHRHVDDVDLFVGGFLEYPKDGSIIGPTFKCILTDEFSGLKFTDRFFYDLGECGEGDFKNTVRYNLMDLQKEIISYT